MYLINSLFSTSISFHYANIEKIHFYNLFNHLLCSNYLYYYYLYYDIINNLIAYPTS